MTLLWLASSQVPQAILTFGKSFCQGVRRTGSSAVVFCPQARLSLEHGDKARHRYSPVGAGRGVIEMTQVQTGRRRPTCKALA